MISDIQNLLLIKYLRNELTEAETAAVLRWLEESEENMRKIFSIIIIVVGLLTVSCNGDMNFDAYNTLPQKNFWQTQADAESAVFACYGKLSDWPFIEPTTFGPEEVASDNTAKGSSPDDQPDINRFKTFTYTPSLDAFNTFWNSRYSLINICNQAITHIPEISMANRTGRWKCVG